MANKVLGVGIIGTGRVTQALHLPALARLPEQFRVAHLCASSDRTGALVAKRAGARFSTDPGVLLADPAVDVVAVNSPSTLHARHAVDAIKAGKKAVLVEKPLATDLAEAEALAACAREAGAKVLVGAMHVFDPGWVAALGQWGAAMKSARLIRSTILLPPNPLFEGWASEVVGSPPYPPPADLAVPDARAMIMRIAVLGLGVHEFPLLRQAGVDLRGAVVRCAQPLPPFGFVLHVEAGAHVVQLVANVHGHRHSRWTMAFVGDAGTVSVGFTPSIVLAGSASIDAVHSGRSHHVDRVATNGCEGEWAHLHDVVTRGARPIQSIDEALEDFRCAVDIAGQASQAAREAYA